AHTGAGGSQKLSAIDHLWTSCIQLRSPVGVAAPAPDCHCMRSRCATMSSMNLNRRNLLQSVSLASLGSFWPLSKLAAARPGANIYQQLGVRPVINCMGAWTVIGASRQWPE